MIIQKTNSKKRAVKASNRVARRNRRIRANEDVEEVEEVGAVDVAPEASDLLFEADDVAELIAEVSGEDVAVTVDDDSVVFEVGEEDVYTVEAEGDEEVLESATKVRGKKAVKASRRVARRRSRR